MTVAESDSNNPTLAVDVRKASLIYNPHEAPVQALSDIDLAILGSPPERFSSYEADVRQEYAWVPQTVYREKRVALLQRFVDRPRLYRSAPAFEMFEAQARINLSEAVLRLSQ